MSRIDVAARTGNLRRIDRRWRDMPQELREPLGELLAEPYLRLSYPTEAAFAAAFRVAPGTPEYRRAWADQVARSKATQLKAYRAETWVSVLYTRAPHGRLVALATMMTVRSTRDAPFADAIGDPASHLPTLRMLRFACGPDDGLPSLATPERCVAEWARICIRQRPELDGLVDAGALTPAEADYVERHAFDEMFAHAFRRDRALPEPPVAYVCNATPRLMDALTKRGLDVRPLYLAAGAEPTPQVLGAGHLVSAFFARWLEVLAPLVPAPVLAEGAAAAIRYLARQGFEGWPTLPLSLPYLVPANGKTAEALAALAAACDLASSAGDAA